MTFFNLDWLNESAEIFICKSCGRLEWFLNPVEHDPQEMGATKCLACDGPIPANASRCPQCGWSFMDDPSR